MTVDKSELPLGSLGFLDRNQEGVDIRETQHKTIESAMDIVKDSASGVLSVGENPITLVSVKAA